MTIKVTRIFRSPLACILVFLLALVLTASVAFATTFTLPSITPTLSRYTVQIAASVQESPLQVNLEWGNNPSADTAITTGFEISRKLKTSTTWTVLTTVSSTTYIYSDTTVPSDILTGTQYEYQIKKTATGATGYGYIAVSKNVPGITSRGTIILIVENTASSTLASKVERLRMDLIGDGWTVVQHAVASTSAVTAVKSLIIDDYNSDPTRVKAVFLLGRVPVPYSGEIAPDGHVPDHRGAWPADVYYADIDGTWTDSSVNSTVGTFTGTRINNVPGDGKFDQSLLPSDADLQVGRVDMYDLPAFSPLTELDLLSRYLDKDHDYRIASTTAQNRSIIHDGFGVFSGSAFAVSAWRNFAAIVDPTDIIEATSLSDYITKVSASSYIWSYANGANSVSDYVNNAVYNVFGMNFLSYEGDWDYSNNMMRASVAGAGYALTSGWAGRPHWFLHHMGLGENIGYSVRLTQNNSSSGQYKQVNAGSRQIHVALIGDPTLRMYMYAPASNITASSDVDNLISVSWTASSDPDVTGYYVYSAPEHASTTGPYLLADSEPVSGTTFSETRSNGSYVYMVRPVKLSTTTSGSFYNIAQGSFSNKVTASQTPSLLPSVISEHFTASSTYDSIVAHGSVYDAGGSSVTTRGFQYGLTAGYGQTTESQGTFSEGLYSATITGLTCETAYHVRAYATNSMGTSYGDDVVYYTGDCISPSITTDFGYGYTAGVELTGTVSATYGSSITERGFRYGTSDFIFGATSTDSGSWSSGSFTQTVTGLTCGTSYSYQAYAINSGGISYGSTKSFVACDLIVYNADSLTLSEDKQARNVIIRHGGTLTLGGGSLSVSGDWTNRGTFVSGTGAVRFNGSSQTLIGSTAFYDLVRPSASGGALYFPPIGTTTVNHLLNISGTSIARMSVAPDPFITHIFSSTFENGFEFAQGVAVDSAGNIYVADCGITVQKFDSAGNFLGYIGSSEGDFSNGGFSCPRYLYIDEDDNLYVADYADIQKYDADGNFEMMVGWGVLDGSEEAQVCTENCVQGMSTSEEGGFSGATQVATDSLGNIYVTDVDNYRVEKFTSAGSFVMSWGSNGTGDGQFSYPVGIVIDSADRIYVVDNTNYSIDVFDTSGAFIMRWGWGVADGAESFEICTSGCQAGISGLGRGQLAQPAGIAIDRTHNVIYVGDRVYNSDSTDGPYLGRIQKFTTSGEYVGLVTGDYGGAFDYSDGIALDDRGNVYATVLTSTDEDVQSKIYRFTPSIGAFEIDSQDTASAAYVSVASSTNLGEEISCQGCADGGNNINWSFESGSEPERETVHSRRAGTSLLRRTSIPVPVTSVSDCPPGLICTPSSGDLTNHLVPNSTTSPFIISTKFSRNLTIGDIGPDVAELQHYLNVKGFTVAVGGPGSLGNETPKFGFLTRAALIRFQLANGITPAVGFFGPITRAFVISH